MKKIICNYRRWALLILGVIAVLGILAVPADELPFTSWLYILVSSKLVAVAAGYIFRRLYLRSESRGAVDERTNFVSSY